MKIEIMILKMIMRKISTMMLILNLIIMGKIKKSGTNTANLRNLANTQ